MTPQRHNFNDNGLKNIWCKFELRAAFPLGARKITGIFLSLFGEVNPKGKKCILRGRL